jgi:hypothetical protein
MPGSIDMLSEESMSELTPRAPVVGSALVDVGSDES